MQKIRIRISGLSPRSIDLLADSILRLSSSLEEEVLFELQKEPDPEILLPGNPSAPVSCHDLLYLVSDRHYVIFHTRKRCHRIRIRFQDAALLVPPGLFLKAGRGVLLNMEHILRIQQNDCVMSDGARFPLCRRNRRKSIQTFHAFQSRRNRAGA